jgi:hypothetical protein
VTAQLAVLPSHVAVMFALPTLTPVTTPLALTLAAALSLDQVTTRPDSGLALASFGVALSGVVLPAATLADVGETLTEATATGDGAGDVTLVGELKHELIASKAAVSASTPANLP